MYKGYEIDISERFIPFFKPIFDRGGKLKGRLFERYLRNGKERYENGKHIVKSKLDGFIRNDGVIEGGLLAKEWFPEIEAHVFLSHSHADQDLAIAFSQYLYESFGLEVFIDSCIWGYANDLLKNLDDARCYQKDSNTYNYDLRNYTTSFVHMLLAVALTKMIDHCECMMFLNTPNSITPDPHSQETSSPWIYYELNQSELLRQRLNRTQYFAEGGPLNEGFRVVLPAPTGHLQKLDESLILKWAKFCKDHGFKDNPQRCLDILYQLTEPNNGRNR